MRDFNENSSLAAFLAMGEGARRVDDGAYALKILVSQAGKGNVGYKLC